MTTTISSIRYDNGNANYYRTLQLWVKAYFVNGAEGLDFVISGTMKKMQLYQLYDVDIVLLAWNFIKNETSAQMISCKFADFYSL